MKLFRILMLAGAGLSLCDSGCMSPGYLLHVTGGELRSLSRSRSIDKVLSKGAVSKEDAQKLVLVQKVRVYARDHIGMNVGSAYTQFEDNADGPVAFAVSGARQDRLEPYEWTYPIIGAYEAKGFFDRAKAEREASRLRAKGYDAAIGEVSGFSTMGILPDPIRASNLESDEVDLAILVFHELTHNTIFKPGDTQFNESMATFVGRAAAEQFFRNEFGENSAEASAAKRRLADLRVIDRFISELHDRLEELYRRPIPREEKMAQKEMIFAAQQSRFVEEYKPNLSEPAQFESVAEVATDNATVLATYRYHSDLSLYDQVQAKLQGDLRATMSVLKKAAGRRDSFAFLRDWLAKQRGAGTE